MTRSSSSRGWKIVLGLIATVLVLFFVAELGLRFFISQQIKSAFRDSAPETAVVKEDAQVHFGASPVVFGLARGKLQHVNLAFPSTLTPDRTTIEGTPAATLDATGFVLDRDDPSADKVVVRTELPKALVRDMLQRELSRSLEEANNGRFADYTEIITVSDVATDPSAGTFQITFSNGAFGVELRPELNGGHLSFSAASTSVLGQKLPDVFSEAVSVALERSLNDQLAGPLRIERFTVVDNGFDVMVSGENVHLNDLDM